MVIIKRYRLLIADDDASFRATLRFVFEPHFQMVEASCGEEAVEIGSRQRIDIALMDMHMRHLTGLDAMRILRSIHAVAPFILVTADATEELRTSAVDAYSILRKPVTKSQLVATVSRALEDTYHDPDALAELRR